MQDFKKKRRILLKIIVFVGILLCILGGISAAMERAFLKNDSLVQNRNKSIIRIRREPEDSLDILVMGDSLSYSSVSPLQLWADYGYTSYVCGQYGQKIQETYSMLETILETQSPRLVLFEASTMFRAGTGAEGDFNGRVVFAKEWLKRKLPVFVNHDIWKTLITGQEFHEESYKGFVFRCDIDPYDGGAYMVETDEQAVLPNTAVNYTEKLQELCEQNGAELVLLSVPSPVNYDYKRHNSIADYAASHNLQYLDMNLLTDEIGIDWQTDSLDDGDHMNLSGAQKVTAYLGSWLNGQYDLPDHRGESAFTAWTEEAAVYEEKAQQHLYEMFGN